MAAAALLEATAAATAPSSSAAAASTASAPGVIQGGRKTGLAATTAHTPAVAGFGTDRSFDLEGTEEETAAQRLAAPSVVPSSASGITSREGALHRAGAAAFSSDEGGASSHRLDGDGADTSFSRLFTMAEYDALASYARVHPVAYGGWYRTNFGDAASLADTPRGAGQHSAAAMVPPPPGAHLSSRSDRTPEPPMLASTAVHGHATELGRNHTTITTTSVGTAMASASTTSSHHHHHRRNATELALALLESDNRLRLLRRQRDAAVARVDGGGGRPSTIASAAAAAA
jgi:hypothetical protein